MAQLQMSALICSQRSFGNAFVPFYIPTVPYDPTTGYDTATTGYVLFEEADGRLTATASGAELGATVTITR